MHDIVGFSSVHKNLAAIGERADLGRNEPRCGAGCCTARRTTYPGQQIAAGNVGRGGSVHA
jgi:hypothetical protein